MSGIPLLVDSRTAEVDATPEQAFAPIRRIGGRAGWYYGNWLWRLRGVLDRLAGGSGLRRGRANPDRLDVGETLDCWRVEAFEPGRLLRLALELKIPGRGWLEFEVHRNGSGSVIRQTAAFEPAGWAGRLYWRLSSPFHHLVFRGMLRGIANRALKSESDGIK